MVKRLTEEEAASGEQGAWTELKALIADRVARAERGEVSHKSMSEIVEEETQNKYE